MKQRDIILVPFPFSDQSGMKIRPALIISNNSYNKNEDVLLCAITSQLSKSPHTLIINQDNIEEGLLYVTSAIKTDSILKIEKSLIIKKIATIDGKTFSSVTKKIKKILE